LPGYRVHDFLTVAAAAALAPAYYALAPRPDAPAAAILAGACLLSGLLFSPDLDLASHPHRRWGRARALWWPYQMAVPHRSWVSHSLVVGPLLRLAYFAAMAYALLWGSLWAVNTWVAPVDRNGLARGWRWELTVFVHRHPEWVTVALGGFIVGGLVHTVADIVWSALRPRRRWHW
jgi:uncharacterized metal-binding protein